MVEVKYGPLVAEIYATTKTDFQESYDRLVNSGFLPCSDYVEASGVYKQSLVGKDKYNLTYVTDYLLETTINGKFDVDIVNKLYDRWGKDESPMLLSTQRKPWFRNI